MKKTWISVALSVSLLLMMLLGVMVVPASASNTTTLTVSNTAGELGETIEVSISVSENSYLVNGDLNLTYDTNYLRYVPDSCEASPMLSGVYWAANEPIAGEVRISFASIASVGITDEGVLFTLQFEIINKDTIQTGISLQASPLCGCNGGDDFDVKPLITGGTIGIVGGADPWNFLQEAFLVSGQENVSIDENGIWTVTGDFSLSPDFTLDYTDWQHIAQKFTTNTPVKITLVDRDPLGVYGEHSIGLYDNFVGPQFYPASSYDQVNSILGIYNWNIANSGWKNTGLATIDEVIVHFETSDNVSATFTSLYMVQSGVTTSSVVRTTATKPTTTTTQVYNVTYTVETIMQNEPLTAGETFTVDVTMSEIDAVCGISFVLYFDPQVLAVTDMVVNDLFFGVIQDTVEGQLGFSQIDNVGDIAVADDTVIATVTFTALQDISDRAEITIDDAKAFRNAPGVIVCNTVNGSITIVSAVLGDVTGDGLVNLNDATSLFYHVNGLAQLNDAVLANADLNADGQVDLSDATMLFYQVNGLA